MTTAATDSQNGEAFFSNYGSCVDIWAPGVGVISTKKGGGTTTFSGTSMASPHVGGAGALYLSTHAGAGPATVEGALKAAWTTPGTTSKDGRQIELLYAGRFSGARDNPALNPAGDDCSGGAHIAKTFGLDTLSVRC